MLLRTRHSLPLLTVLRCLKSFGVCVFPDSLFYDGGSDTSQPNVITLAQNSSIAGNAWRGACGGKAKGRGAQKRPVLDVVSACDPPFSLKVRVQLSSLGALVARRIRLVATPLAGTDARAGR